MSNDDTDRRPAVCPDSTDSWAVRVEELIQDAKENCYSSDAHNMTCELLRIQIRLQAEMLDKLELLFKPTFVFDTETVK